jgi:hypothetical protein
MASGPISESLVRQTLQQPYPVAPPPMPGGQPSDQPVQRVMNALGSEHNSQNLVLAAGGLNMVKSAVSIERSSLFSPSLQKLTPIADVDTKHQGNPLGNTMDG